MKKMNKILALSLALTMMFALAACGNKGGNVSNSGTGTSSNAGDVSNAGTSTNSSEGGAQANDNPYNLDYTSAELQPMSDKRASKDTLLEAKEYYIGGLQSAPADFSKMTYKDVEEHIGVDASEFQYFDKYKQYRYTWYVEGNEGPSLLATFDANGNLYAISASIS